MSWSKDELHDLQIAGRIAKLTLDQIENHIKPGVPIGKLFDSIVRLIKSTKETELAFPPNISINECAAHDSAAPNEKRTIPQKALIKIDIGANVNGMLSDAARTFTTDGKNIKLIKASKEALDNAIKIIEPGLRINEIGKVIQDTIEGYGFKTVANLTGHQLDKNILHSGLSIPNIRSMPFAKRDKLKIGMILAIEPFASNGNGTNAGYVEDAKDRPALIFSSSGTPKTEIGKFLVKRFKKLPFALRSADQFLRHKNVPFDNLMEILNGDHFHCYKPLMEKTGGLVSQAEHTILVTSKGAKVITE